MTTDEAKTLSGNYGCNDCGSNVVEIGEFYMLRSEIWNEQLGLDWHDNLCIGCLEKRIGRNVSFADMCGLPCYPWMKPSSPRLLHRFFGQYITKRPPYRLLKRFKGSVGMSRAAAKIIGEYAAREAAA